MSFALLAAYVGIESICDLTSRHEPDASIVGIILATASLIIMPLLARAKRRLAPLLGS